MQHPKFVSTDPNLRNLAIDIDKSFAYHTENSRNRDLDRNKEGGSNVKVINITSTKAKVQVQVPTLPMINAFSIGSVCIPFSFYTFRSTNNKFGIAEGGGTLTATITPGNYTATEMTTVLAAALNAVTTTPLVYTVTFDSTTGKFTISATGNFTIVGSISNFATQLGFETDSTVSASKVATNCADLTGSCYISIKSNALSRSNYYLKKTNTTSGNTDLIYVENSNVLTMVPISGNRSSIIYYNEPGLFSSKLDRNIYNLDFELNYLNTTELVDFNGKEWSMDLVLYYGDT